jgi:hypothetical protein
VTAFSNADPEASSLLLTPMMCAPDSAKAVAIARPIPRLLPVTSASLLSTLKFSILLFLKITKMQDAKNQINQKNSNI